jgi:predicted amidohydrolase
MPRSLSQRARDLGIPVVAANRLGLEGDTVFCGHSMVLAPSGEVVADAGTSPGLAMAELSMGKAAAVAMGRKRGTRDPRFIHPEVG